MKLYERYPTEVSIDGNHYPIKTDFREWIKFYDLATKDMDDKQRVLVMFDLYEKNIPADMNAAMEALCWFFTGGDKVKPSGKRQPLVYDFETDMDYFVSGFRENYGISLMAINYMHWWEFLALFRGMNSDTELKQRMQLRSIDLSKVSDIKEKARIRRAQLAIALPVSDMDDEDIGEAFESVF